jgi:hypothetical protein
LTVGSGFGLFFIFFAFIERRLLQKSPLALNSEGRCLRDDITALRGSKFPIIKLAPLQLGRTAKALGAVSQHPKIARLKEQTFG